MKGEDLGGGDGVYGTSSTGYAGHFSAGGVNISNSGCLYFNGTSYHCGSSDRRLKQNIQPLKGALDQVLQLKGVTFEFKDPAAYGRQFGTRRGFIAQDVEEVHPEWVGEDEKGFKTLNIQPMQFEALTVESFRELKTENDALKERIARLEKLAGLSQVSWAERNQTLLTALMGLGLVGGFAGYSRLVARRKREDEKRA